MNKYDDVYLNPFGNVVFVKNNMDYSFMSDLRGKRTIDVNTHKTFFITTIEEIKKLSGYEKIIKKIKGVMLK